MDFEEMASTAKELQLIILSDAHSAEEVAQQYSTLEDLYQEISQDVQECI